MKLIIKAIFKKKNIKLYVLFFALVLLATIYCIGTINYLVKYENDNLNKKDNLLIEMADSNYINYFDNVKDKIEYICINNLDLSSDYNVCVDINNYYNLNDSEIVVKNSTPINTNDYSVKKYIKSDENVVIINKNLIKNNKFLFTIVAKDYQSKLNIIKFYDNKNVKYGNIIAYESSNNVQEYKNVFLVIFIVLMIISGFILYLYNKDDKEFNKLLRIIGYNKLKLIFINYLAIYILITILYIICMIIIFTLLFLLKYNLDIGNFLLTNLYFYIIINIIYFSQYLLFYNFNFQKAEK